jgi:uncharacterized membrane protein YuzA (DUF378 family)
MHCRAAGALTLLTPAAAILGRIFMRIVNQLTLFLLIVGGFNWGLVGLFGFDLVAAIFGEMSALSRIVYVLVGASALWQIMPLLRGDEARRARAA